MSKKPDMVKMRREWDNWLVTTFGVGYRSYVHGDYYEPPYEPNSPTKITDEMILERLKK